LKRERRVVDTVDIPYSCYICPFQVEIILETISITFPDSAKKLAGRLEANPP
jgi:hypothetical protein